MKGEGEGELLLVGRSDRHSVIFMFDQGRRIWMCLLLEQQEVVMRTTEVDEGAIWR